MTEAMKRKREDGVEDKEFENQFVPSFKIKKTHEDEHVHDDMESNNTTNRNNTTESTSVGGDEDENSNKTSEDKDDKLLMTQMPNLGFTNSNQGGNQQDQLSSLTQSRNLSIGGSLNNLSQPHPMMPGIGGSNMNSLLGHNMFVQRPPPNQMYMYYPNTSGMMLSQPQQQNNNYSRQDLIFPNNSIYQQGNLQHPNNNNGSSLNNNPQGVMNLHPNLMMGLIPPTSNILQQQVSGSNINPSQIQMNMIASNFSKMGPQMSPPLIESGHPAKSTKKRKKKRKDDKKTSPTHRMEHPKYESYIQPDKLENRYPITELAESLGFKKKETKTWRYRDLKRFLMQETKMKKEHEAYIKVHHPDIAKRLPHKMTIVEFIKRMALLVFHFIIRDGKEPLFWTKINSQVKDDVFTDFLLEHDKPFYNMINQFVARNAHSYIKKGYSVVEGIKIAQEQFAPSNKSATFATTCVTGGVASARAKNKLNGFNAPQSLNPPPPPPFSNSFN